MLIDRAMFTSPEMLGMRRLPTAATFYHFKSEEESKAVKKEFADSVTPLNGTWRFCYTTAPEKIRSGIVAPGTDVSAWDEVEVPDCWAMRGVEAPHYTNIIMPFEAPIPEVPQNNPTGIYRRTFEFKRGTRPVSAILHFDGAESFFAVYVNGKFAGKRIYQKDPDYYTPFALEITDTIDWNRKKQNIVVRVQDKFGAGGIWKPVYVTMKKTTDKK